MVFDRRDLVTCAGLFLLALLVRLPYLHLVPRFTDEFNEVLWAWRVADEGWRPLTHNSQHIGIVYPYLLAALFGLVGPSIELPRFFVTVFGACLAPATYALGCTVTRRAAAFLAATLVSASSALVLINCHIAYSSSLTPFFVTLALCLTMGIWSPRQAWLLPLAGVAWGVALQTHPAAAPWLAGVTLGILSNPDSRQSMRKAGPWLVLVGAALSYSNMIVHNLTTDFGTLRAMQAKPGYFASVAIAPAEYSSRLRLELVTLVTAVAGVPDLTLSEPVASSLAIGALAALGASAWSRRRSRGGILAVALLSAVLVSPLFNARFSYPSGTRYLCPALPVVFVLFADAILSVWSWRPSGLWLRLTRSAVLGGLLIALGLPVAWLSMTYKRAEGNGQTNRSIIALVEAAAASDLPKPVILDSHLDWRKVEGGGLLGGVTRYLLTMREVPYETWDQARVARAVETGTWPTMILLRETYEQMAEQCYPRAAQLFGLAPIARVWFDKFKDVEWSAGLFAPAAVQLRYREGSTVGEVAVLVGYTWSPEVASPGDRAFLTLYWQPLRATAKPLSAFVHIVGPDGRTVAQADGWPGDSWTHSTVIWQPHRLVEDRHWFVLPEYLAARSVHAHVGLYDPDTGERLLARAADGSRWPANAIRLPNSLSVIDAPTNWPDPMAYPIPGCLGVPAIQGHC